jgi:hypothetical protein
MTIEAWMRPARRRQAIPARPGIPRAGATPSGRR